MDGDRQKQTVSMDVAKTLSLLRTETLLQVEAIKHEEVVKNLGKLKESIFPLFGGV